MKTSKTGRNTKGRADTVTTRIAHAYQQAPWRLQTQWIGFFLLALLVVMIIAGIYLNITARTAEAGVQFQLHELSKDDLQIEIAELRSQYGILTSAANMEKRAAELGFQPADMSTATYVIVPQYGGRDVVFLSEPPTKQREQALIVPAYTQSLWDWLFQGAFTLMGPQPEVVP